MRKSKCEKQCHCGGSMILYGKAKDGRQKYKCRQCGAIATDNIRFTSGRKADRLLSFLLNILDKDFYNSFDLQYIFNSALQDKDSVKLNKIYFNKQFSVNKDNITIKCRKPKLLICAEGNDIIFYQLPKEKEDKSRTITIIDDDKFNSSPDKNYNCHLYENR